MAKRSLNKRERISIAGGVIILVVAALVPAARDAAKNYDQSVAQLTEARNRIIYVGELRAAVESERSGHRAIIEKIRLRSGRFDLYSFTNSCLRKLSLEDRANLEERRVFTGASVDGVQLRLSGVSMDELTDLFHTIYASNNLIVLQRLDHLRAARDGKGLDCQLTFISPKT